MRDQEKAIDPLPESFESEEEAGEFWDTHSLIDYERYLQPTDEEVEISERELKPNPGNPATRRRDSS